MKTLLFIAALTLPLANAHAEEPVLDGGVDTTILNEIPDHAKVDHIDYPIDLYHEGVAASERDNNTSLGSLSRKKDCGKADALKAAQLAAKRINVFRALLERDKKNLAAAQRAYDSREHSASSWGFKNEANAIPVMTKTLDDLQAEMTTGRFAALKDVCTTGSGKSLELLDNFIKVEDKAIMNGGDVPHLPDMKLEALLTASGKVVPNKSLEVPEGHLGFIRSVPLSHFLDKNGGCGFDVPFDELAVSKVLQEKTYDGKKLAFACSEKFKGVNAVDKGDTVEIQINQKQHDNIFFRGVVYPDSRKIMDKVMEVTDGPGAKYMWHDYGSTDGVEVGQLQ